MSNGTFFERYKPYFRFSQEEMEEKRSGMLFDKLPAPLRPFTSQVFTKRGQTLMNTFGVPKTLGSENRKLVAGSPLLLGVMLDRSEYRPGQLSSFYSRRPAIDWSSSQRKLVSQYVFREDCDTPQQGWDAPPPRT
ncbi:unnamed protein product [Penicillium discolor]